MVHRRRRIVGADDGHQYLRATVCPAVQAPHFATRETVLLQEPEGDSGTVAKPRDAMQGDTAINNVLL